MANVLGELFQGIADAIRAKNGETGSMKPIEFPEKILSLENSEEFDDILDEINGEVIGEELYTITFIGDDGNELCQMNAYEQDNCADPIAAGVISTPTKESTKYDSFTFAGWSLSAGGEVDDGALKYVTSDRTLYAVFNIEKIYLASGSCGSNAIWAINPDYVLELSGTGGTHSYYNNSLYGDVTPWNDYQEVITSVIIGEGITSIGMYNFTDCTALTSVAFPSTMRMIANSVFKGCTALTSIDLPAAMKYIMESAFYECSSLVSVNFERTSGWFVSDRNYNSYDTVVDSSALANPETAATYLTDTYAVKDWMNADAA